MQRSIIQLEKLYYIILIPISHLWILRKKDTNDIIILLEYKDGIKLIYTDS